MDGKQVLFFIIIALIAWFVWVQFRDSEKRKDLAAQRGRDQQAARARREAEEAERQRQLKAAEAAAWRVEVPKQTWQSNAESEEVRRLHQQEQAAQQEQKKLARQAAAAEAQRQLAKAEARLLSAIEARSQAEAKHGDQRGETGPARRLVDDERASIRAMPIAGDIQRAMREFLSNNQFFGEDHSPLTYVGYRVGKTNGLPVQERRRRLRACFQIEIPPQLAAKYQAWGAPVTYQRFTSMCQHITMLADMRRERPNYEVAVSDWEADEAWLKTEYGSVAERLRRLGIG